MSRGKTLELMRPDPNTGKVGDIIVDLSVFHFKENQEVYTFWKIVIVATLFLGRKKESKDCNFQFYPVSFPKISFPFL